MKEPPGPAWLMLDPDAARRPALPVATAVRPAAQPVDPAALDDVARRLAAATRPLIVAGRECRAAATTGWLRALAEAVPAPVLVTPAARGAMPDPHPLCFGPVQPGAPILARADLVVALGVDADELAGVTVAVPVLHVGHTPAWPGAVAAVEGDVDLALAELAPRLRGGVRADWDVAEMDRLRRARPMPALDARQAGVVGQLREATPAGTAAVFSRAVALASAVWLAVNPGELFVTDAVVPAALAVALHRPESAVLAFTDDGSTAWADLAVAVEMASRVIVVSLADVPPAGVPGVRTRTASPGGALALAIGDALEAPGPTVITVA
jgi:acetolactate synthase-1/2/3 large subunit